jgi:preprotein translocase subunit SecD
MGLYARAKDNWRVLLLTLLLVLSGVALFVPGAFGSTAGSTGEGISTLQYGIELDGGTRIRAPIVGQTAELQGEQARTVLNNRSAIRSTLASELNLSDPGQALLIRDQTDGQGERTRATVELFVRESEVSQGEFAAALQSAGVDASEGDVRSGVTGETRSQVRRAIQRKISAAGLSGREVRTVQSVEGNFFVVIEVPDRDPQEIRELLSQRGNVEVDVFYTNASAPNGTTRTTVLQREDIASVGQVQQDPQTGQDYVSVTLTDEAAPEFQRDMTAAGFGDGGTCRYDTPRGQEDPGECLLTVSDDEVVYSAGVQPDLGRSFASGDFEQDPTFIINAQNFSEARRLQINLQAGELRAPLNFEEGTQYQLEPTLAENFKQNSLLTGIAAVVAVTLVVYFRYGDPKIALPMVLTALSEVVILLGFAAVVQLQLDLSHIAGLIAVIGTGVDDLIIIADEVQYEGEVDSATVFQSRFRKAFWVIGAAAATTIVAMSPLAVLSLGDLQGFAIVTIMGVLIGVLITRPAYGDILRRLTTSN